MSLLVFTEETGGGAGVDATADGVAGSKPGEDIGIGGEGVCVTVVAGLRDVSAGAATL